MFCILFLAYNRFLFHIKGTLLNSKSQITSANARALKEAVSRGVKVVIATGKVRTIEFIDYHDIITEVDFNIIPYLGKYIFNTSYLWSV